MTDVRICPRGHRIEGVNAYGFPGRVSLGCRACINASRQRNRAREKETNRDLRRRADEAAGFVGSGA